MAQRILAGQGLHHHQSRLVGCAAGSDCQRDPLPGAILAYRKLSKLLSTYVEKLPDYVADDGRVHTNFHQAVAATGRLSSSDPNLQNIPIRTHEGRRIRAAFVPAPGKVFLSCDYSQIELRIPLAGLNTDRARTMRGNGRISLPERPGAYIIHGFST